MINSPKPTEFAGKSPSIEAANKWPVVMTYDQKDNKDDKSRPCTLSVRAANPNTVVPAYPDWSSTTLLGQIDGKIPKRLIQLPDGTVLLLTYDYGKHGEIDAKKVTEITKPVSSWWSRVLGRDKWVN